jgi:DNA recombination protein RmuC
MIGAGSGLHMGFVEIALLGACLLLAVCAALLFSLHRRTAAPDAAAALAPRLDALSLAQERTDRALAAELARSREELASQTRHLREEIGGTLRDVGASLDQNLARSRDAIDARLRGMQEDNQKKLDEMRATVDEKLQATIEQRLGAAFKQVSDRLEAVHKGLGEMQSLAVGVGDLKRVLTNVKTRGGFGETQLEALLEHCLAPGQYAKNVQTRAGSAERVDFAVRMPNGANGGPLWLPIDAKFPQEDYARLQDAAERGDLAGAEEAGHALEMRIRSEAKSIRDKYVSPPSTTDFALLFLPTEGLYAEVLRRPGLVETLQRDCKVVVVGPTTLAAILNSLQMGFRTLAIEKRSHEVWQLLGAVKTQFGQFGALLEKVDRKLQEASTTIGDATRKTRFIQGRLGKVEALPELEAVALLPEGAERSDGDVG